MSQPRPRALVGALAALLFVACTAQPMPDPSTPPPVAADAESDVNAQPRDRLRDGGLLRFPLAELPTQWKPRPPDAEAGTQRVLAALNPTHLTLDAAGRATPNPDFVADLAVEHGDRTVVTLDLVERAVWGDATPITAADWVATWRADSGQVPDLRFASSDGWERVAEVREGANPRQVVVTFHDVDPASPRAVSERGRVAAQNADGPAGVQQPGDEHPADVAGGAGDQSCAGISRW